jgi:hypothetical protein
LIDYVIAVHSKQPNGKTNGNGKPENWFRFDDDDIDELINSGAPVGQRSEAFSRVVWSLAGQGLSLEEIEKELRSCPNGIAAKYLEPDRLDQRDRAVSCQAATSTIRCEGWRSSGA